MDGFTRIAPVTFGDLLRQHRLAAGLTQETLAERAGLSVRGISDLERGARTHPYRETVNMLAGALGLAGAERAAFAQRARRGRRSSPGVERTRGQLPEPLTSLVGRQADIAAVHGLFGEASVRLVTLTGPGGVGKTRLALAVADGMRAAFPGGILFIDLAPLSNAAEVTTAIGATLGLGELADNAFVEQARRAIGEQPLLLILDNFEHLLDGAAVVGELLRGVPSLTVLATSREALRLRGEREYIVAPLALPEFDHEQSATMPAVNGAVQLFVERARVVDPQFELSRENVAAVAAICQRLDGLPLAIELAAARAKVLPPAAMLARLERQLSLLTGGPRDVPERQRTMRDAIAWSYDLLTPGERALFRQLAIFSGGFHLEAVEAIGGDDSAVILDLVASLIDKSLLVRRRGVAGDRFVMLETVREFARERLRQKPADVDMAQRAHAAHYLALAEEARYGLVGAEQARWLARLDADEGNLRTALDWTIEKGASEDALRFASALWRYWSARGRLADGRRWLERALAGEGVEQAPAAMRATAHNALGNLLGDSGEYAAARHQFEAALTLRRVLDDEEGVAGALNNLGLIAMWLGEYETALHLHQESLEIRRRLGDQFGEALSLSNLGDIMLAIGDFDRAREYQTAALRLREAVNDATGCAYTHYNLGEIARLQGDFGQAVPELMESLHGFEKLGDRLGIAYAEWSLSDVVSQRGDVAKGADLLEHALETRWEIGDQRGFAECLEMLGAMAIRAGFAREGLDLLRDARAEREMLACPAPPVFQAELDRAVGVARERLGLSADDRFWEGKRERAEGKRLASDMFERLLAREDDAALS